ncbi:MAG: sulfatase-like hydrolase/transferase [Bacteroidota bacterium]|nr:MAG: sulfatase-like hydrolase/transferase [Bacteroidota bacterium]
MNTSAFQKPFFGFLFYDSPHNYNLPYWLPHPFKPYWENVDHTVLNNDFDPVPFYNSYKNTVWFCDSLIQQVLSKLEEKNLLENTIVVITSDHGQEFNENKKIIGDIPAIFPNTNFRFLV